jgi:hypothetical protein
MIKTLGMALAFLSKRWLSGFGVQAAPMDMEVGLPIFTSCPILRRGSTSPSEALRLQAAF